MTSSNVPIQLPHNSQASVRRKVGEVYEIVDTTTRYEYIPVSSDSTDPGESVPTREIPDPPELLATLNTVLLWDWTRRTKINDESESDASQQVVSANNVFPRDPAPGDPANSEHCYTKIVRATTRNVVEFGVNQDVIQRAEGAAARMFIKQWGFMQQFTGKIMRADFALYFPDEFVVRSGAGVALGAGVQNKNPEVSYGLNLTRPTTNDPLRFHMWDRIGGSLEARPPLADLDIPFWRWIRIRYESLLHKTGGWLNVMVGDTLLFHAKGRTDVAGFGPVLYNVNGVAGLARMLFSDMRIDIVSA